MQLSDRVLKNYYELTKTSKAIADVFLEDEEQFLGKNALALGKLTHTSSASVIRFCQQLGLNGLPDFQIPLAADISNEKSNNEVDTIVAKNEDPIQILIKLRNSLQADISELIQINGKEDLVEAENYLSKANTIYLEGLGASALAAKDLYYKLIRLGRNVYFNDDPHIALERSYYTTSDDVMIVFSYSGHTKEALLIAHEAREHKTPIITVSRNHDSALVDLATVKISLPANEKLLRIGAINSLLSEMICSSMLYLSLISEDLPNLFEKMRDTQHLTNHLKELK